MSQSSSQNLVTKAGLFPSTKDKQLKYAVGYAPKTILKWIAVLFTAIYFYGAFFQPTHLSLRYLGSSAFPMFAYFVADGYEHTRSKLRYALRLLLCGCVAQVPYVLCFQQIDPKFQWYNALNPVITYFIGLLLIWTLDQIQKEFQSDPRLRRTIELLFLVAFGAIAYYFPVYHSFYGVLVIALFWLLREDFLDSAFVNWFVMILFRKTEMWALPGYIIISGLYNQRKGKTPNWIFYVLFPAMFFLYWLLLKV